MKELILLSLILFFVGCAHKHPQASFHIGMTADEFKQKNPTLKKVDSDPLTNILSIYSYEEEGKPNAISYLTKGAIYGDYLFTFKNDTLIEVAHGIFTLHNRKHPN